MTSTLPPRAPTRVRPALGNQNNDKEIQDMDASRSQPVLASNGQTSAEPAAAHTPGPWVVKPPWAGFSEIRGPKGELIFGLAAGHVNERQPESVIEANAHVIEAATDLLEALRPFLRHWEPWMDDYDADEQVSVFSRHTFGELRAARAAIAKAGGAS